MIKRTINTAPPVNKVVLVVVEGVKQVCFLGARLIAVAVPVIKHYFAEDSVLAQRRYAGRFLLTLLMKTENFSVFVKKVDSRLSWTGLN